MLKEMRYSCMWAADTEHISTLRVALCRPEPTLHVASSRKSRKSKSKLFKRKRLEGEK